ncbi:redoxin domain-containing protein [Tautonia sociabilis]|uniref:Redoxin domain-containing protein n=1 Tax=Tautonia sociabilis TaxID=2080755 RepID=A0A432MPW6_9BACT|nr:redoxin domain-containing protein [Tautonia sociabilis]RUL89058.1 redoxin domain-containing protein [Tautonia sociabilis]
MMDRIGPAGLAGFLAIAWAGACSEGQVGGSPSAPAVPAPAAEPNAQDTLEDEDTGLPVGALAPSFSLKDQEGKQRSLDEFLIEGKTVALVFFRSADW